jgi:hypothetical protein
MQDHGRFDSDEVLAGALAELEADGGECQPVWVFDSVVARKQT